MLFFAVCNFGVKHTNLRTQAVWQQPVSCLPDAIQLTARKCDDSPDTSDLSHYEKFFDDLGRGFPQKAPPISFGCSKSANNLEKKESLEVFQIGNYVGSFVPTIAEFSQLDERFGLPAATWDQIPEYNDYSFAVFQLSEGSLRPHPMEF